MVSPKNKHVDIPIEGGFVGMVDRDVFDEWLRARAVAAGAARETGTFRSLCQAEDGTVTVAYAASSGTPKDDDRHVRARVVIGADGALSEVARQAIPGNGRMPYVFAYHEIIATPQVLAGDTASGMPHMPSDFEANRCDVIYRGETSPDFYCWIFPHGATTSIGTGSARKGFSLRGAVAAVRKTNGLEGQPTLRREGAPIPLKPLRRWDNGRNVVLAGDAAGVVAPASGEGIYYAMLGGRLAAGSAAVFLATGDVRALASARRKFMRSHGLVFAILGVMQYFWYSSDERRERFVAVCRDRDVQRLTFEAYMQKKIVWRGPLVHARIFFKDIAHLLGLVRA